MIRLRDLTRVYATGGTEVHALAGVSLEIGRGEFVAIMGQSGSGKTTMMNIIGLLDRPSGGEYAFGGRDVSQLSEDARARLRGSAFGFVFQSYNLLPRMTALEQVELPLIYQGVRDRRRRAAEALVRVGLRDRITHQPTELSGGEQQRVAIARSLVVDPLVLLADEPTGALDTATGHELMTLLAELVDQQGLTVVLVTHEPEVAAYARRTVRMRDGRIIEDSGAAGDQRYVRRRRPARGARGGGGAQRSEPARRLPHRPPRDLREPAAQRAHLARPDHRRQLGDRADRGRTGHAEGRHRPHPGLGTDLIFVESSAAATTSQGGGLAGLAQSTLVQGDATAIAAGAIPGVVAVTARVAVDAQAVAGANNVGASIVGTSSSYAEVRDLAIRSGSFITPLHDEDRSLVAVLGARVAETLYPGLDPVGQEVRLSFAGGRITFAFVVIGVLEEQGGASEANDQIFVPLSGVAGRLRFLFTPSGDLRVTQIDIQTADGVDEERLKEEISELLLFLHDTTEPDFVIQSQDDLIDAATEVSNTLSLLLGSIAGISLLVGGIGVMNIMLVSVTERTREIGIRRAVGATAGDIVKQFVTEALTLSLFGGVVGIAIGIGGSLALDGRELGGQEMTTLIQPWSIAAAFLVAAGVGFASGSYPAYRATTVDPIAALRNE